MQQALHASRSWLLRPLPPRGSSPRVEQTPACAGSLTWAVHMHGREGGKREQHDMDMADDASRLRLSHAISVLRNASALREVEHELLWRCALLGDAIGLRNLVKKQGVDINAPDPACYHATALHLGTCRLVTSLCCRCKSCRCPCFLCKIRLSSPLPRPLPPRPLRARRSPTKALRANKGLDQPCGSLVSSERKRAPIDRDAAAALWCRPQRRHRRRVRASSCV